MVCKLDITREQAETIWNEVLEEWHPTNGGNYGT